MRSPFLCYMDKCCPGTSSICFHLLLLLFPLPMTLAVWARRSRLFAGFRYQCDSDAWWTFAYLDVVALFLVTTYVLCHRQGATAHEEVGKSSRIRCQEHGPMARRRSYNLVDNTAKIDSKVASLQFVSLGYLRARLCNLHRLLMVTPTHF